MRTAILNPRPCRAYALGYVDDLRDPLQVLLPRLKKDGMGEDVEATRKKLREMGMQIAV